MIPDPRPARRAVRQSWLEAALIASAFVHALLLAIFILARRADVALPPPPPDAGFEMVFQGGVRSPDAVPAPGKFITIPKGVDVPTPPLPTQQSQSPPPPQASPAPQVNLLPPELRMLAPPEPQPDVQATQQPTPTIRRQRTRTRTAPNPSPFASPQQFSFASRPSAPVSRGLRDSKSIDLSLGRPERGGMSDDGMLHFTTPGASGSYAELLHEYVEEHKYYPEQAIENQEEGMPVISATLTRDGRIKNLRLVESSGSPSLDMAWFGLFRTMQLPPFPADMTVPQLDFTYAIEYELIRH